VVRGGPQAVLVAKALQKIYQTLNDSKIHMYMLELPLLANLQQKVGELVIFMTSCPLIITLENT
jgi:5,10-methylene-tetrahydrofolate dehydrogenase/methenyl tetrahydrofolate cyclohydrolase